MSASSDPIDSGEFAKDLAKLAAARIGASVGFHAADEMALTKLGDMVKEYIETIGRAGSRHCNRHGRSQVTLDDLGEAFREVGVDSTVIGDYLQQPTIGRGLKVPARLQKVEPPPAEGYSGEFEPPPLPDMEALNREPTAGPAVSRAAMMPVAKKETSAHAASPMEVSPARPSAKLIVAPSDRPAASSKLLGTTGAPPRDAQAGVLSKIVPEKNSGQVNRTLRDVASFNAEVVPFIPTPGVSTRRKAAKPTRPRISSPKSHSAMKIEGKATFKPIKLATQSPLPKERQSPAAAAEKVQAAANLKNQRSSATSSSSSIQKSSMGLSPVSHLTAETPPKVKQKRGPSPTIEAVSKAPFVRSAAVPELSHANAGSVLPPEPRPASVKSVPSRPQVRSTPSATAIIPKIKLSLSGTKTPDTDPPDTISSSTGMGDSEQRKVKKEKKEKKEKRLKKESEEYRPLEVTIKKTFKLPPKADNPIASPTQSSTVVPPATVGTTATAPMPIPLATDPLKQVDVPNTSASKTPAVPGIVPCDKQPDLQPDLELTDPEFLCICSTETTYVPMAGCDGPCQKWFHPRCLGQADKEPETKDFYCHECLKSGDIIDRKLTTSQIDALKKIIDKLRRFAPNDKGRTAGDPPMDGSTNVSQIFNALPPIDQYSYELSMIRISSQPMCLNSVNARLNGGYYPRKQKYPCIRAFHADVLRMFDNCRKFNSTPDGLFYVRFAEIAESYYIELMSRFFNEIGSNALRV